jgi:Domain of unknown function (DUF4406)
VTSMGKVYLAGPMTGLPQFNFPAFADAAFKLRAAGYDVVSPAETDTPEVQKLAMKSTDGKLDSEGKIGGKTWGDILADDVKLIADTVSGIAFLDGWTRSRGAKLEATVGLLCNHNFYQYADGNLVPKDREWVKHQLAVNL